MVRLLTSAHSNLFVRFCESHSETVSFQAILTPVSWRCRKLSMDAGFPDMPTG